MIPNKRTPFDASGEQKKIPINAINKNTARLRYWRPLKLHGFEDILPSNLPQAINNIAVIYHYQGVKASEANNLEVATMLFDKAGYYWRLAIKLAPNNYIEAQNWLKTTGRN